jgi:hypothetical protein
MWKGRRIGALRSCPAAALPRRLFLALDLLERHFQQGDDGVARSAVLPRVPRAGCGWPSAVQSWV